MAKKATSYTETELIKTFGLERLAGNDGQQLDKKSRLLAVHRHIEEVQGDFADKAVIKQEAARLSLNIIWRPKLGYLKTKTEIVARYRRKGVWLPCSP